MAGNNKFYFPTLDGFRALAAVFILLYHSGFSYFKTLWIGVPMFFVLSGFLITLILSENKHATNYFKAFYFKRSLRIFPIYYLALAFSIIWGLLTHADLSQLPYFIFYLQNFLISTDAQPYYCYGLMGHTWSLSVEECFYLVWPFIVYSLNQKKLFYVSFIIGTCSILFKVVVLLFFYTTTTGQLLILSFIGSLDGLMAGALLAIMVLNKEVFGKTDLLSRRSFYIVISAFVIVLLFNCKSFAEVFYLVLNRVLLNTMTVIASFYVLTRFISPSGMSVLFYKIFTHPALRFIGKISYGLYLYHFIIYRVLDACFYHYNIHLLPFYTLLFKILLTFIVSVISWFCIEKPILKLKNILDYQSKAGNSKALTWEG